MTGKFVQIPCSRLCRSCGARTRPCRVETRLDACGKPAIPNRITKPCYKRGEGVDLKEADERNKRLAPFPKP
jgi:hypothetical protein